MSKEKSELSEKINEVWKDNDKASSPEIDLLLQRPASVVMTYDFFR